MKRAVKLHRFFYKGGVPRIIDHDSPDGASALLIAFQHRFGLPNHRLRRAFIRSGPPGNGSQGAQRGDVEHRVVPYDLIVGSANPEDRWFWGSISTIRDASKYFREKALTIPLRPGAAVGQWSLGVVSPGYQSSPPVRVVSMEATKAVLPGGNEGRLYVKTGAVRCAVPSARRYRCTLHR